MAEGREYLAAECGDGGLAVGAGDGDAGLGLVTVEGARRQGIGAADIVDADQRPGRVERRILGRQHRRRPLFQRLWDEIAAVVLAARQGAEQDSLRHLAAIGRDARDQGVVVEVAPQDFGKAKGTHDLMLIPGYVVRRNGRLVPLRPTELVRLALDPQEGRNAVDDPSGHGGSDIAALA